MALKHQYKSLKPDPADSTIIGASKWNADHYFVDSAGTPAASLGAVLYVGTSALVSASTNAFLVGTDQLTMELSTSAQRIRLGPSTVALDVFGSSTSGGMRTLGNTPLSLGTNGTTHWYISETGHFFPHTNNVVDIGTGGAYPRTIYASTSFRAPDGTASVTGYGFTAEANTGFYRAATGLIDLASQGTGMIRFPRSIDATPALKLANTTELLWTVATVAHATACTISVGTGTPEGAKTANVGSLFLRTDGGASTTLYVKQSGTGNTGWAAK